jgi:hypothetical protein
MEGNMNVEMASRIQARIRAIEERLGDLGFGPNTGEVPPADSDLAEIGELYEERESLIQELALAAWEKTQ